jgi:kynurenine formamidase
LKIQDQFKRFKRNFKKATGRTEKRRCGSHQTGQAQHYHNASHYLNNFPGINLDAVKWLIEENQVMLLGADNLSFEAFPPEKEENWVPVHTYLLSEKGVMCIEQMYLEKLSQDKIYEFAFISASLILRGASGSPLRPIALLIRK